MLLFMFRDGRLLEGVLNRTWARIRGTHLIAFYFMSVINKAIKRPLFVNKNSIYALSQFEEKNNKLISLNMRKYMAEIVTE